MEEHGPKKLQAQASACLELGIREICPDPTSMMYCPRHRPRGADMMEKQPDSRMHFLCGIENPMGPDGAPSACTSSSTPTRAAASLASGPGPSTRGIAGTYMGV